MTKRRGDIMTKGKVETHHVTSRCAQQKKLCGLDSDTGKDYSHRRDIVAELIRNLALIFAIDVANYSILSNHLHLILRSRPDIVETWSDEQCAWNYKMAWPQWSNGRWDRTPTDAEVRAVLKDSDKLARARGALGSISDFMARLKQPLSTLFNAEMETKGHFWDGRFGSRMLLSDDDAFCCSLYCDVNQIRAGAARTLVESDNSGIQDRILAERARAEWVEKHSAEAWRELLEDVERGTSGELNEDTLRELYRDGWLAPISDRGPLATTEQLVIVNAAGESIDSSASVRSESGELLPNISAIDSSADENAERSESGENEASQEETLSAQQAARKRGRPRKTPTYSFDRKFRKRLRKRRSDRCFLNISWSEYERAAQEIVDSIGRRGLRACPAEATWKATPREIGDPKKSFYGEVQAVLRDLLGVKTDEDSAADSAPDASRDHPAREPPRPRRPPPPD